MQIHTKENISLIVMNNFAVRGGEVNKHLSELLGVEKDFRIPFSNPRFSNGEAKIVLHETMRGKDVYILADIGNYSLTYEMFGHINHMSPDEHLQDIVRVISAIGGKAGHITVIMPLLYQSRQHRRSGRESLDCAMALRYLRSLGVDVFTIDAHDPEIQNVLPDGGFETIFPFAPIVRAFVESEHSEIGKEKMLVISPDTGAMGRAKKYASVLGLDIGLFYKRRDYTRLVNGKNPVVQHEYLGQDVAGKSILIVDDMLSSGESIVDIIHTLKARGCNKVYAITTFAFFTEGTAKFDKLHADGNLEKIYSTNGSYLPPELLSKPWFVEVSLTQYLARIIAALHKEESISPIIEQSDSLTKVIDRFKKLKELGKQQKKANGT